MDHQQKYVMLSNDNGNFQPPPHRRNIPRYHSNHHKSGKNCCFKCICCCYCFLFSLILILLALIFFLFVIYRPQVPNYKVDKFDVGAFNVQQDFSLYTEFAVTIKADNPNEKIGIVYGKESSVVVSYSGTTLCSGKLPSFHQPEKNVTMMNVALKGKSAFGSGLQEALMENKHLGKIPLVVRVKVPFSVVLGDLPLRQILVFVNCSLVVDNLSPNKKIGIVSSTYDYNITLWT